MRTRKFNILFISAASEIGGAEKTSLDLAAALRDECNFILLNQSHGSFSAKFEKLGFNTIKMPLPAWRKTKNFFKKFRTVVRLLKIIQQHHIDIIHCNSLRLTPYLYWVLKFCPAKGFLHLHDVVDQIKLKKFYVFNIENIVAVSQTAVYGLPNQDIQIINNAVDSKIFFNKNHHRHLSNTPKVIGIVSHLNPVKRHALFIDVAAQIKKFYRDVKFVIVGDNAFNTSVTIESLRKKAHNAGLSDDDIYFTGTVTNPEKFMQEWDLFLLPSKSESFGIVLLEAMACGCVVFAHHTAGGPSEIIENGKDGFLINFDDIEGSSLKIIEILRNQKLKEKISVNAINKINEQYDLAKFKNSFLKYYENLLKID